MIALIDDLDQQKVSKNSKKPKTVMGRLNQVLTNLWIDYRKRRTDRIALHQLMQLDDALLKDMGLSRNELLSVRNGTLTFDSLVKQDIMGVKNRLFQLICFN